jgi:hypothetical protein
MTESSESKIDNQFQDSFQDQKNRQQKGQGENAQKRIRQQVSRNNFKQRKQKHVPKKTADAVGLNSKNCVCHAPDQEYNAEKNCDSEREGKRKNYSQNSADENEGARDQRPFHILLWYLNW